MQKDMQQMQGSLAHLQRQIQALQNDFFQLQQQSGFGDAPEQVLVCQALNTRLALDLRSVIQVLPIAELAPIPDAPPWVPGLLNLRGESIPVLDVAARMQGRARQISVNDLVVVCLCFGRKVGLVLHAVFDVLSLEGDSLQRVENQVAQTDYLWGTLVHEGKLTQVIHVDAFVTASDLGDILEAGSVQEEEATQ